MSPCMLITHNDHNNNMQVYSVPVMTHAVALEVNLARGHLRLLPLALNPIQKANGVDTSIFQARFPGLRHVRFRCRYFSVSSHEKK